MSLDNYKLFLIILGITVPIATFFYIKSKGLYKFSGTKLQKRKLYQLQVSVFLVILLIPLFWNKLNVELIAKTVISGIIFALVFMIGMVQSYKKRLKGNTLIYKKANLRRRFIYAAIIFVAFQVGLHVGVGV